MIEMATLLTLIERCAPEAPAQPLVAAVRQASGFEPLVLATRQNGRVLSVQAQSRDEAIALASEMKVAGKPVRLGLAGIDARELERRNLPIGAAFDACANLRLAGEIITKDPKRLAALPAPMGRPPAAPGAERSSSMPSPAAKPQTAHRPEPEQLPPRAWDVYGQARAGAALVYDRGP